MTVKDAAGTIPYQFEYDPLNHLEKEQGHVSNTYHTDSIHNRSEKIKFPTKSIRFKQLKKQGNCAYEYPMATLPKKSKGNASPPIAMMP